MDAFLEQNHTRDPPPRSANRARDDPSIDTTVIARSVGSIVGRQKNAFLRSFTLQVSDHDGFESDGNDLRWDVTFSDPVTVRKLPAATPSLSSSPSSSWGKNMIRRASSGLKNNIGKHKNKSNVRIASIAGHAALSQIAIGDVVTKINGKRIGPSYNADRCSELVNRICIENSNTNGILSIQAGNEDGMDTVLEATVLKPHPEATAKEMGLEVWWWRGLCIRSVQRNTLFEHSGLKMDDELESINGISLTYNDKVTAKDFNRIVKELPCQVTIVVKRSKHRYSGEFD